MKVDVETVFEEDTVMVMDVDVEIQQGVAAEYTNQKVVIAVLGLADTLE